MDYNPKLLPGNIEAEASLLGCLLINGKLFSTVEGTGLNAEDFYEERHAVVFRVISAIYNEGKTPDVVTVGDKISNMGVENIFPDMKYLYDLAGRAPTVSESILVEYCNIIIEKSLFRELIKICAESSDNAYRQSSPFEEVADKSTSSLINLSNRRQTTTIQKAKDLVQKEIARLEERIAKGSKIAGISCGYPMLDDLCSGFKPGDMIVLAGRPGMGKTSFALNMAIEIARNNNNVLFFSLEMPANQIISRMIATECSVSAKRFNTGSLEKEEIDRLWSTVDRVSKLPIFIDDTSKLTVSDLRSRAKKLDSELKKTPAKDKTNPNKLDCIFVDYLQLMSSNVHKDDRVRQVEDISRNIKLFAKDLGIPIIALAQLNRKVEERSTNKIPMLSDLKDSGSIEQDADMVMFIHREDVYKKDSENKNIADIFVQKNRHGQQGHVKLRFVPQYTKFASFDYMSDDNSK
ncbi:MAG TPA: replicative DNA helicase [bacterium]|nr:replicative DNA helicase [bacterium]